MSVRGFSPYLAHDGALVLVFARLVKVELGQVFEREGLPSDGMALVLHDIGDCDCPGRSGGAGAGAGA